MFARLRSQPRHVAHACLLAHARRRTETASENSKPRVRSLFRTARRQLKTVQRHSRMARTHARLRQRRHSSKRQQTNGIISVRTRRVITHRPPSPVFNNAEAQRAKPTSTCKRLDSSGAASIGKEEQQVAEKQRGALLLLLSTVRRRFLCPCTSSSPPLLRSSLVAARQRVRAPKAAPWLKERSAEPQLQLTAAAACCAIVAGAVRMPVCAGAKRRMMHVFVAAASFVARPLLPSAGRWQPLHHAGVANSGSAERQRDACCSAAAKCAAATSQASRVGLLA